ncbi:hypothetical protein MACJ_002573 [Theileria orientalis]|uniref:Uncharacterized protein n=1 Tax=Theileria orientalis TaxID=68886 RepID=A0A976M690_THEOR|nr:hypothetical protein MACJ_002573 [Theileria orientalis]
MKYQSFQIICSQFIKDVNNKNPTKKISDFKFFDESKDLEKTLKKGGESWENINNFDIIYYDGKPNKISQEVEDENTILSPPSSTVSDTIQNRQDRSNNTGQQKEIQIYTYRTVGSYSGPFYNNKVAEENPWDKLSKAFKKYTHTIKYPYKSRVYEPSEYYITVYVPSRSSSNKFTYRESKEKVFYVEFYYMATDNIATTDPLIVGFISPNWREHESLGRYSSKGCKTISGKGSKCYYPWTYLKGKKEFTGDVDTENAIIEKDLINGLLEELGTRERSLRRQDKLVINLNQKPGNDVGVSGLKYPESGYFKDGKRKITVKKVTKPDLTGYEKYVHTVDSPVIFQDFYVTYERNSMYIIAGSVSRGAKIESVDAYYENGTNPVRGGSNNLVLITFTFRPSSGKLYAFSYYDFVTDLQRVKTWSTDVKKTIRDTDAISGRDADLQRRLQQESQRLNPLLIFVKPGEDPSTPKASGSPPPGKPSPTMTPSTHSRTSGSSFVAPGPPAVRSPGLIDSSSSDPVLQKSPKVEVKSPPPPPPAAPHTTQAGHDRPQDRGTDGPQESGKDKVLSSPTVATPSRVPPAPKPEDSPARGTDLRGETGKGPQITPTQDKGNLGETGDRVTDNKVQHRSSDLPPDRTFDLNSQSPRPHTDDTKNQDEEEYDESDDISKTVKIAAGVATTAIGTGAIGGAIIIGDGSSGSSASHADGSAASTEDNAGSGLATSTPTTGTGSKTGSRASSKAGSSAGSTAGSRASSTAGSRTGSVSDLTSLDSTDPSSTLTSPPANEGTGADAGLTVSTGADGSVASSDGSTDPSLASAEPAEAKPAESAEAEPAKTVELGSLFLGEGGDSVEYTPGLPLRTKKEEAKGLAEEARKTAEKLQKAAEDMIKEAEELTKAAEDAKDIESLTAKMDAAAYNVGVARTGAADVSKPLDMTYYDSFPSGHHHRADYDLLIKMYKQYRRENNEMYRVSFPDGWHGANFGDFDVIEQEAKKYRDDKYEKEREAKSGQLKEKFQQITANAEKIAEKEGEMAKKKEALEDKHEQLEAKKLEIFELKEVIAELQRQLRELEGEARTLNNEHSGIYAAYKILEVEHKRLGDEKRKLLHEHTVLVDESLKHFMKHNDLNTSLEYAYEKPTGTDDGRIDLSNYENFASAAFTVPGLDFESGEGEAKAEGAEATPAHVTPVSTPAPETHVAAPSAPAEPAKEEAPVAEPTKEVVKEETATETHVTPVKEAEPVKEETAPATHVAPTHVTAPAEPVKEPAKEAAPVTNPAAPKTQAPAVLRLFKADDNGNEVEMVAETDFTKKNFVGDDKYEFKSGVKCTKVMFGDHELWKKGDHNVTEPVNVTYRNTLNVVVVRDNQYSVSYKKDSLKDEWKHDGTTERLTSAAAKTAQTISTLESGTPSARTRGLASPGLARGHTGGSTTNLAASKGLSTSTTDLTASGALSKALSTSTESLSGTEEKSEHKSGTGTLRGAGGAHP